MSRLGRYNPGALGETFDSAGLSDELYNIKAAIDALFEGRNEVFHQEPLKLSEGIMVFADGTDWNPGHGGGYYEYKNGKWNPLFPLSPQAILARATVDGDAGADGTTETVIYSVGIPAEALHAGEVFQHVLTGIFTKDGSSSFTIRFKINGTVLHSLTKGGGAGGGTHSWKAELVGTIRTEGVSGTSISNATLHDDSNSETSSDSVVNVFDTTIAQTFSVTIQWSATHASNLIHVDQGFMTVLH